MKDADVAVVGLGSVGVMAAWQLGKKGRSVIGIEQFGVGHDYSGAGGESRIFRTAYLEGVEYVPILLAAQERWRELEKLAGVKLLTLNGGLMIGSPDSTGIRNVLECVRRYDLPHEILDERQLERSFPQHKPVEGEIAVLDRNAGFLRPELAVVSAVRCAQALGVTVLDRTRVQSIEVRQSGVRIVTDRKTVNVEQVVVACGAWTTKVLPRLTGVVTASRIVLGWFPALDIDMFAPSRFPVVVRESGSCHFSCVPSVDGVGVKVSVNPGQTVVEDADRLDRSVTEDELDVAREVVQEFLVGLTPEAMRRGAYMDSYTSDRHGIVGTVEQTPSVVVLAGFSGHGFKMAPAIGEIASQLIVDGKSSFDIDHLSPLRFSPGGQRLSE